MRNFEALYKDSFFPILETRAVKKDTGKWLMPIDLPLNKSAEIPNLKSIAIPTAML